MSKIPARSESAEFALRFGKRMSFRRAVIAFLLDAVLPICAAAQPATSEATATSEVSFQLSPDGGLEIKAPAYHARIGADGNLHSLRVGETEMLDNKVSFSLGAFFYSEGPRRLGKITLPAPGRVRATDGYHTAEYLFLASEIRLTLAHTSERKVPFYLVLSEEIATATNPRTGEVAAVPTEEHWSDVTFTARSGAYMTLRGGDRIWGPWAERQMWELGPLGAGELREVSISPGIGPPPKPTPSQLLSLRVEPIKKEQTLGRGESVELSVMINNRGEVLGEGVLRVQLRGPRGEVISEVAQSISVGEKTQVLGRFDIALAEPGLYAAQVTLFAKNRPLKEVATMLAFRPEEIRPPLRIPPDFEAFWSAALAQARASSPQDLAPEFIEEEALSSAEVKAWRVSFSGERGKRLSGWLCVPARPGRHPGLLQLPGYGRPKIEPPIVLAGRGYAALAVEVVPEDTDTAYIVRGLEEENTYFYRELVINCLRALDLLLGRTEVDPARVAVSGASQGGGLALIVAALRREVAAVAADVPMLCDLPRAVREGGWPYSEIARYLKSHPEAEGRVWRILSYFDVLNFAPRVQIPALFSLGLQDAVCRPETIFAAYNYLPGSKEIKVYPEAGHEGGGSAQWIYKLQWLDSLLKPVPAPPAQSEQEKPIEPIEPTGQ